MKNLNISQLSLISGGKSVKPTGTECFITGIFMLGSVFLAAVTIASGEVEACWNS